MGNKCTDHRFTQLVKVNPELESKCLVKASMDGSNTGGSEESFCASVWDSVYCWPATQSGTVVEKKCADIFRESFPQYGDLLVGFASRECLMNGTWGQGNETDYKECKASFQFYLDKIEDDNFLIPLVHHMLFFGSIFSLLCLGTSLAVFYKFPCLRSDRVTIHVQLMFSLVFRFLLMFFIAEPFVIGHNDSYRDVDILCKITLILFLYSSFSSIGWMFVEGLFLNIALMAGVVTVCTEKQLIIYYTIGWGVPVIFVGCFVIFLVFDNDNSCWHGYSEMDAKWILVGPIIFELVINGMFLLNILRILLNKINNTRTRVERSKAKAAAKAILILFPVLGINNLLLLYNPGGAYNKYFVLLNTFFSSTQGIFVCIVFCFADKDVVAAIRRSLDRSNARRMRNCSLVQNAENHSPTPMMEMFARLDRNQCNSNSLEHSV